MDDYFKLPTGYACLARDGEYIRAYQQGFGTRDTFELDNLKWVKVATQSTPGTFSPSVCLPQTMTHLIPSSVSGFFFAAAVGCVLTLVAGLFSIFRR